MSQDPIPVFDVRLEEADVEAVAQTLRSGLLKMAPRRGLRFERPLLK